MTNFDKQRIENAVWTLLQYEYELKAFMSELGVEQWDYDKVVNVLEMVQKNVTKIDVEC